MDSSITKPTGTAVLTPPATRTHPASVSLAPVLWFSALVLALYAPVLARLVTDWYIDEDMGHGFFVPVVAGWVVYQRWDELMATPRRRNWFGYVLIAWAILQLIVASLGVEFFLARTSFLICITGVILALCGMTMLRKLAFPLALLVFMIPLPSIIYNQITFPLQLFASGVAEVSLSALNIPVLREGNVIELTETRLSVVEACSGIRSLLSLSFLSLVYAYLFDPKPWMRTVLFLTTIPIAILANAFRVTLTGVLTEYKREWAEGFFHTAEGWVIFMVALAGLLITHKAVNLVYGIYRRNRDAAVSA